MVQTLLNDEKPFWMIKKNIKKKPFDRLSTSGSFSCPHKPHGVSIVGSVGVGPSTVASAVAQASARRSPRAAAARRGRLTPRVKVKVSLGRPGGPKALGGFLPVIFHPLIPNQNQILTKPGTRDI